METTFYEDLHENNYVKKIVVPLYRHEEAGLHLLLRDMTVYIEGQDRETIDEEGFDPTLKPHSIPKYEVARIYLLLCALTGDDLGFRPEDQSDPIYSMYERAYQKSLRLEDDPFIRERLAEIAAQAGFTAEGNTRG